MSIIKTFTGKNFDSLNPSKFTVDIEDIAHSLSMKCRFGGHVEYFYSVAQHSIHVMHLVEQIIKEQNDKININLAKKVALLHDSAEAYFSDIPNPIKRSMGVFSDIENKILTAIYDHFNIDEPPSEIQKIVKKADEIMLYTEARDLFPLLWFDFNPFQQSLAEADKLAPWDSKFAEKRFLQEFEWLTTWKE